MSTFRYSRYIGAMLCVIALHPSLAIAQTTEDHCRVVLESGAFNRTDRSANETIARQRRDALCRESYSNEEEFRSSVISAGFNYDGFMMGVSGSGEVDQRSGRVSFQRSRFCSDSFSNFFSRTNERLSEVVADVAVNAWASCRQAAERRGEYQNRVWIDYETLPTGVFGTLSRSQTSGSVAFEIRGVLIHPSDRADEVSCRSGPIELSQAIIDSSGPIAITSVPSPFECTRRDPEMDLRIGLDTSSGALQILARPASAPEQIELARLSEEVASLTRRILDLEAQPTGRILSAVAFEEPSEWDHRFTLRGRALMIATAYASASIPQAQTAGVRSGRLRAGISVDGNQCSFDGQFVAPINSTGFHSSTVCIRVLNAGSHWVHGALLSSGFTNMRLRGSVTVVDLHE